jgi:D-alanine-D-alanine ligase
MAKRVFVHHGIPTPPFTVIETEGDLAGVNLPLPLFVKPMCEGSSLGIRRTSRVTGAAALAVEVKRLLTDYGPPVLIESFLPGVEVTVGVIGNGRQAKVLGVMEVEPRQTSTGEFVYGLEAKRDYLQEVLYHTPPKNIPATKVDEIERVALAAYAALGCRDVARLDLRLDAHGVPNVMEVNPLPGLSPATGDLVFLTRPLGIRYDALIGQILAAALTRIASGTRA